MYEARDDPYCYKGTTILKNKLRLRDAERLAALEAELTSLRGEEALPDGDLGVRHYLSIHRHLFQDVYGWAGEIRTIRVSKGDAVFCYPENITRELDRIFAWLVEQDFLKGLDRATFAAKAAHFLAELNAVHPFREGNGRAQNAFLVLLAERAGHSLAMPDFDPSSFLAAMLASFKGDEAPLAQAIERMIRQAPSGGQ